MTHPVAKQIAAHLEGMTPDEARKYLARIKADAIARAAEEKERQAASQAEIKNISSDDLTEELEKYNPRTGDRERYHQVKTELRQRQRVAVAEANLRTMEQADWQEIQEKRETLSREIKELGVNASRHMAEIREKSKALNELMAAEPDVVLPPPVTKGGEE